MLIREAIFDSAYETQVVLEEKSSSTDLGNASDWDLGSTLEAKYEWEFTTSEGTFVETTREILQVVLDSGKAEFKKLTGELEWNFYPA